MSSSATARSRITFPAAAWTVVAIALAIRLLHVYFTQRFNPLSADLQLDAATYDRWARALAFGGDTGPTTLMQSPVYPWFLSLIYRAFGPELAAARIAQALLGTASCGLIMLATRRFFRSDVSALLAGLIAAFYAPLVFYEGILLPATIVVFLNALFISVMFTERRPGTPRLLAAGIVLGAAAAANPPTLLLFPFALLHLHFAGAPPAPRAAGAASAGEAPAPRRAGRFLKGSLALTLGVAAALSPLTVRNALRTGEFIPLTAGAGINFYHGNNPEANGFYQVPVYRGVSLGGTPEEQSVNMERVASKETGRILSQTEVSNFWLGAGLDYIRGNPGAWAALVWRKFQFFWNAYERANVENFSFHRRFRGILSLPLLTFGVVAPLGLLGVFLTSGRRRRLLLLYGGIFAYFFTALVFYVLARYRLSVVVFLIPFAGAAVVELVALARGRRVAELALSLAALGALAFFSNRTVARDTPGGISSYHVRAGNAYVARGDTTRAEGEYRKALELNGGNEAAERALEGILRGGAPGPGADQKLR
ncbi:MAG: glycosyltransferase family 39 protein [Candidatus Krumholzibacteria bacterium]|nr:glycosyltransferase family 39 protein [Candidatus Krumholzibacteria bacterium]